MDFLQKLTYLMEKKHLNKSTLSKACDIPYTTIDGWYKKGYEGVKLTTLRKLTDFFGTTLDYWTCDDDEEATVFLTMAAYRKLKPEYQEYVYKQIEQLLELQSKEPGK